MKLILLGNCLFTPTNDYRQFMQNWLDQQPKSGHGEINRIAKYAGVHPSLISQVLSGSKNLNLEQAQLVCEYLGFTTHETEFFLNLVQLHRAGTEKLKTYFRLKLDDLKKASADLAKCVRQDKELSQEIEVFADRSPARFSNQLLAFTGDFSKENSSREAEISKISIKSQRHVKRKKLELFFSNGKTSLTSAFVIAVSPNQWTVKYRIGYSPERETNTAWAHR